MPLRLTSRALHPSALQSSKNSLQPLRRSQLRAARPRIAINLFFTGRNRLFGQQPISFLLRAFSERVFHPPVFQRVKTDYHQPSLLLQDLGRRLEQRIEVFQFTVYEYSDRLKGSSRWMNSPTTFMRIYCRGASRYNFC